MKLRSFLYILLRAVWLIVGATIGVVATIFIKSNTELFLNKSLYWGIAIGFALTLAGMFLLVLLKPKEMDLPNYIEGSEEDLVKALEPIAARIGLKKNDFDSLNRAFVFKMKILLSTAIRMWSGITAISMAIAVCGSIIAMITALAAIQQVNRIDAQNKLLAQQSEILEFGFLLEERVRQASFGDDIQKFISSLEKLDHWYVEKGKLVENAFNYIPSISDEQSRVIGILTGSMRPYWLLDTFTPGEDGSVDPEIIPILETENFDGRLVKLSPERGRLLTALVNSGVSVRSWHLGTIDENRAFRQGYYSSSDVRGARLKPSLHPLVLEKFPILNELADTRVCNGRVSGAPAYQGAFPYIDPEVVKGSSFAGSSLTWIHIKDDNSVDFTNTYLNSAILNLTDKGDKELKFSRVYDVEIVINFDQIYKFSSLIEFGGFSSGTEHNIGRANCFRVLMKNYCQTNLQSCSDSDRVEELVRSSLISSINMSPSEFDDKFNVYVDPGTSESKMVIVRRLDGAVG